MNLVYVHEISIPKVGKPKKCESAYIGSTDATILDFNIYVVVSGLLWLEGNDLKLVPVLGVVDAGLDGS
jgi:hypothetical protein